MTRIVTYRVAKFQADRSLIDFLYGQRAEHPKWIVEKDDLESSLKVKGHSTPFSLVIKSADETKLIAAIPESDPFTVDLYDVSAYESLCATLDEFDFEKTVIVRIKL